MTDQERSSNVSLKFTYDRAAQAQVKQAVDSIIKELGVLNSSQLKASVSAKQLAETSKLIGRDQSIRIIVKDFVTLGKTIGDDTAALKLMRQSLREFGSADSDINKATRAFKEMQDEIDKAKAKSGGIGLGQAEGLLSRGAASLRGVGLGDAANTIAGVADGLQLIEVTKGLASGFTAVSASVIPLLPALLPLAALVGGIAVAFKLFQADVESITSGLQQTIRTLDGYVEIISGTSDEGLDALKSNQEKIKDLEAKRSKLMTEAAKDAVELQNKYGAFANIAAGIDPNLKAAAEEIKKLDQAILDLQKTNIDGFQAIEGGATAAADAEVKQAEEAERLAEAAKNAAAAEKFYHDTIVSNQEKRRQETAQRIEQEKKDQERKDGEMVNVLKRRDASIISVEEQSAQARIDLETRTTDKIEQIIQQSLDANDALFRKLQEREAQLHLDSDRGDQSEDRKAAFENLKLQIEDNRKERDELESHLERVAKLRDGDRAAERDAIYDRNFDALFRLQEKQDDEVKAEEASFKRQTELRERTEQEQAQDTARQRQFERNERRIALQNALTDARNGYLRELELQRQAKENAIRLTNSAAIAELNTINSAETSKINMLRQAAIIELGIVNQTEAAKYQVFLQYLNQARGLLGIQPSTQTYQGNQVFSSTVQAGHGIAGTQIRNFASGGSATAGQPFIYNEPWSSGNESFGGYKLPGGMGVAMPFKSGNVDAGSSGDVYVTNQIVVQGSSNPTLTAQEVVRISDERSKIRIKQALGMRH